MLLQGVSQQLHVNAQLLLFGLHPATAPSIVLRRQQRIMQVELPHFHHKDLEEGKGDVFSSEEAQLSLDFLRVVHPHCPLQRRNVIVVFLPLLEYCDFSEGRHCEVFYEIVSLCEP